MGEVESTKSVSEIYAPVAGTIVARNDAVETAPETLNTDPYEGGWLFVLEPRILSPPNPLPLRTTTRWCGRTEQ